MCIKRGCNIVSQKEYNKNMDNLRVFYHCAKYLNKIELTLNLVFCVPTKLLVL